MLFDDYNILKKINENFLNPFLREGVKLNDPFICLNDSDFEKVGSRLCIDSFLLELLVKYSEKTSYNRYFCDDKEYINISLLVGNIKFFFGRKNKQNEKGDLEYLKNYITIYSMNTLTYRFNVHNRCIFSDDKIKQNSLLRKLDNGHSTVVSLCDFDIINYSQDYESEDINYLVKDQSDGLFNLLCDCDKYPKYNIIDEVSAKVHFPQILVDKFNS